MFATGGEGREIALLAALHVRTRTVVTAKLFAYGVPTTLRSIAAVVLVVAPLDGLSRDLIGLAAMTDWASASCIIFEFAASSTAPNFHAEHIQRATGILGRVVALIAGGLFLLLSALGAASLPGFDGAIGRAIGAGETREHLATAALVLTIAAAIPALMLLVARDRWRKLLGAR